VLQLPRTLTSIDFLILFHVDADMQRRCHLLVMQALTRLPSLQWLRIRIWTKGTDREFNENWSLLPSLTNLRHLRLTSLLTRHSLLQYVKQLPQLRSLILFPVPGIWRRHRGRDVEILQALCQPPHQLNQLQSLGSWVDTTLTAEHMELLIHLPSLTTLPTTSLELDALPFLPRFRHLNEFSVRMNDTASSRQWIEAAASHLAQCPSLTSMNVTASIGFHDGHLNLLFRSLPHLRRLTIFCRASASASDAPGVDVCDSDSDSDSDRSEQKQPLTVEAFTHVAATLEQLHLAGDAFLNARPLLPPMPRLHTLTVPDSKRKPAASRGDNGNGGENMQLDGSGTPLTALTKQMGITRQRTPMLKTIKIGMEVHDVTHTLAEGESDDVNEGNMAAASPIRDVQSTGTRASSGSNSSFHTQP